MRPRVVSQLCPPPVISRPTRGLPLSYCYVTSRSRRGVPCVKSNFPPALLSHATAEIFRPDICSRYLATGPLELLLPYSSNAPPVIARPFSRDTRMMFQRQGVCRCGLSWTVSTGNPLFRCVVSIVGQPALLGGFHANHMPFPGWHFVCMPIFQVLA